MLTNVFRWVQSDIVSEVMCSAGFSDIAQQIVCSLGFNPPETISGSGHFNDYARHKCMPSVCVCVCVYYDG